MLAQGILKDQLELSRRIADSDICSLDGDILSIEFHAGGRGQALPQTESSSILI